jgi:hypothetical protein
MLAIIATVGWIAFDVYFCLRTTMGMSGSEWWTLLIGGVGLGLAALVGELLDRKSQKDEIVGLNNKLRDLKTGQTYQSGQMSAISQLIGNEAMKTFASEMRVPVTEATKEFLANEFMEGVRSAFTLEQALRAENERLTIENKQLREDPTEIVIRPEGIVLHDVIATDPRVRAVSNALHSSEIQMRKHFEGAGESLTVTIMKSDKK